MSITPAEAPVPYYSQWESPSLVPQFVAGALSAADDPLWQKSGAATREEYAFWAPRICGIACLRMALDRWKLTVPPSVPLLYDALAAGAYERTGPTTVKGLIYAPFADWVRHRWALHAVSAPDLPPARVRDEIRQGHLVMLSVHKTIRTAGADAPPQRGGHLVLAVAADRDTVYINNPSGFPQLSQQNTPVPWSALDRFYAGRGVILGPPTSHGAP